MGISWEYRVRYSKMIVFCKFCTWGDLHLNLPPFLGLKLSPWSQETDIMGCFRGVAQEMGCADEAMMVSMLKTAPRHLELQMPGTIRWLQKIQPQLVLFCPFMNGEAKLDGR